MQTMTVKQHLEYAAPLFTNKRILYHSMTEHRSFVHIWKKPPVEAYRRATGRELITAMFTAHDESCVKMRTYASEGAGLKAVAKTLPTGSDGMLLASPDRKLY